MARLNRTFWLLVLGSTILTFASGDSPADNSEDKRRVPTDGDEEDTQDEAEPGKGSDAAPIHGGVNPNATEAGSNDYCLLDADSGDRCRQRWRQPRWYWYFNKNKGRCKRFLYLGCDGNENNFHSRRQCRRTCALGGFGGKRISKHDLQEWRNRGRSGRPWHSRQRHYANDPEPEAHDPPA